MTRPATPLWILALLLGVIWAGCDNESGFLRPNEAPNTRISAGPPESKDTGYQVHLFWFGWDNDGFVDHYEIAWETPENWMGPIYAVDSTFSVQAADRLVVGSIPPPGYSDALRDSVFEQYHTFYVRAIDNEGLPDESPSFRTFNAKTLAPFTELTYGPRYQGRWGSRVTFKWRATDPDRGTISHYRYALASLFDFARDPAGGDTSPNIATLLAWVDSITYYPKQGGGYHTDSLVWRETTADSIVFRNVLTTADIPPPASRNKIIFAVRAVDNAGAEEQVLNLSANMVLFDVSRSLNGPCMNVTSNIVGTWSCFTSDIREIFSRRGLRFSWTATPGGSQTPVAGFSYAVDDTAANWSPFSINTREYPERTGDGSEDFWFPDAGAHTLFLRAVDQAGFINVLPINLQVFDGPKFCAPEERFILVVLDTNPADLIQGSRVFPSSYRAVERGLIEFFFEGYNIQVHETRGSDAPDVSLMNCASSMFWFLSTDAVPGGDTSTLSLYHATPPNILPSYVGSGGNLFLCGIEPVNAMRYTESNTGVVTLLQNTPYSFERTLVDTSLVDHWIVTQFGIATIEESVSKDDIVLDPTKRFSKARSQIRTGDNPYPDLEFDPLSWPDGPQTRGFAFYDVGLIPHLEADSTTNVEVIYTLNDTGRAVAVRRLTEPGPNSNMVYVGFHPYFLQKAAFREFIRAVMADFGEVEVANP